MLSRRQVLGAATTAVVGFTAGCSARQRADLRVSNSAHLERTLTVRISEVDDAPEPTDDGASTWTAVQPFVFDRRLTLESDEVRTFTGVFEPRRRYAATVDSGDAVRSTGLVTGDGVQLRVAVDADELRVFATTP